MAEVEAEPNITLDSLCSLLTRLAVLPSVAPGRVGVAGSPGLPAYLAARLLARDRGKMLACAVIQSPVADWTQYGGCDSYVYLGRKFRQELDYRKVAKSLRVGLQHTDLFEPKIAQNVLDLIFEKIFPTYFFDDFLFLYFFQTSGSLFQRKMIATNIRKLSLHSF